MANKFDPLAGMDEEPKAKKTQFGYKNPLEDVSATDARKAIKSSKIAGKHIRVTLLLLPEMEEEIEQIAQENGLGKNELARWLISLGLQKYHKEGVRPKIERITSSKVSLPDWK